MYNHNLGSEPGLPDIPTVDGTQGFKLGLLNNSLFTHRGSHVYIIPYSRLVETLSKKHSRIYIVCRALDNDHFCKREPNIFSERICIHANMGALLLHNRLKHQNKLMTKGKQTQLFL